MYIEYTVVYSPQRRAERYVRVLCVAIIKVNFLHNRYRGSCFILYITAPECVFACVLAGVRALRVRECANKLFFRHTYRKRITYLMQYVHTVCRAAEFVSSMVELC